jgi:peptidyl-prolyl cis-trans isomerase SurA
MAATQEPDARLPDVVSGRGTRVALAAVLLAAVGAGSAALAESPDDVLVRVGSDAIVRGQFEAILARFPAASGDQRQRQEAAVVEQLVEDRLLRAELDRLAIVVGSDELEARLAQFRQQLAARGVRFEAFLVQSGRDERSIRDQMLTELRVEKYVQPRLTAEALAETFEKNHRDLDGTRLRVSHILLRPETLRGDDAVDKCLAEAEEIRRRIMLGNRSFEDAALMSSAGPSRRRGGDLGWITREAPLVDAFARQAFLLAKGEVSRPFVTPFGVHVIKVTDVEPGTVSMDTVRPRVQQLLVKSLVRDLVAQAARRTQVTYAEGVPHFDPETPANGPQPRRVVVGPPAAPAP